MMTKSEQKIKEIISQEFSKLITTIENDFKTNYDKKSYNFLLSSFDKQTIANMVFVSSFESKSGFAIETCAKRIARLRFGEQNVPTIVNPQNINHNINPNKISGQIIVTNVDINNGNLRGEISTFRQNNIAYGKGKTYKKSSLNQDTIKSLISISDKYKSDIIYTKPVDLAFFDGSNWVIMEIKAGGDLDSSNAPSNVEKLLTIYTGLNVLNSRIYFATIYNKNGEGNTWTGTLKKHMAFPEMFLIGKDFWNTILPKDINYEGFIELYIKVLEDIRLNEHINTMIKSAIKS